MNKPEFNNVIQVAGIIDWQEANMLINCGVKYLGFPLRLPVNKEDISEEEAAKIIKRITPQNYGVIISYSSTVKEIIELCNKLATNIIQLHGSISEVELKKLKSVKPEINVIKSLVIKKDNINELKNLFIKLEPFVDAFITDTYDPDTGASGATGKTHDWNISKQFVEISSKPVILAGGLNADNVYEAIKFVKPAGVDVHTGVENIYGRKDEILVRKFIEESNKAFKELR